jgi:hypothetical protein
MQQLNFICKKYRLVLGIQEKVFNRKHLLKIHKCFDDALFFSYCFEKKYEGHYEKLELFLLQKFKMFLKIFSYEFIFILFYFDHWFIYLKPQFVKFLVFKTKY